MFDIIFFVLIVLFSAFGLIKGVFKEMIPTSGLVIGYLAAGKFHVKYLNLVGQYTRSTAEAKVISYIAIILVIFVGALILDSIIFTIFKRGISGTTGRLMGGGLGIIKGGILCLAIFYVVRGYIPSFSDELNTSVIAPYLQEIWKILHGIGYA